MNYIWQRKRFTRNARGKRYKASIASRLSLTNWAKVQLETLEIVSLGVNRLIDRQMELEMKKRES